MSLLTELMIFTERQTTNMPRLQRWGFFSLAEAADNSPQFQLRVDVPKIFQAPEGRLKTGWGLAPFSAVPPGLNSFCSCNPQLKLRDIFIRRGRLSGRL